MQTVQQQVVVQKPVVTAPVQVQAPKQESAVKRIFVMANGTRPVSGENLWAHTMAAFVTLGMWDEHRPAVPKASLQAIVGSTAIGYHTNKKQTLEESGGKIRLSVYGMNFFANRIFNNSVGREKIQRFVDVMGKGVEDLSIGVRQSNIVPVGVML